MKKPPLKQVEELLEHEKKFSKSLKEKLESKSHAAVILGRCGGLKGGAARAKILSPERRKEISRHAAKCRWLKYKKLDEKN